MADEFFLDPTKLYTPEYLIGLANAPASGVLLQELQNEYAPQSGGLMERTRKAIASISPAYRNQQSPVRGAPLISEPENIQSPFPNEAPPTNINYVGAPVAGKDIALDQIRAMIRRKESSNNYSAQNPRTSASGAYQYIDSTWNGYGGYAKAKYAPPAVQDARFNEDLARRLKKYKGDPFKMIAAHYMPAYADNPERWLEKLPVKTRKGTTYVDPVADYVRYVVKDTPLEQAFNVYLNRKQ